MVIFPRFLYVYHFGYQLAHRSKTINQWIGLRDTFNRNAPWSLWENRWFPVKIFPNQSIDLDMALEHWRLRNTSVKHQHLREIYQHHGAYGVDFPNKTNPLRMGWKWYINGIMGISGLVPSKLYKKLLNISINKWENSLLIMAMFNSKLLNYQRVMQNHHV